MNSGKGKKLNSFRTCAAMLFAAEVLCSPSAMAQSSVTLYGIVDIGLEYINNTASGGSQTSVASGNLSGSRFGLKGVEDLGGGLSAIFTLENGFNPNNGTLGQSTRGIGTNASTTTRLFGRQAWVGLSYKGQRLTLGRQNSVFFDQLITYDPMGVATRYSSYALDASSAGRIDNSVKYFGTFGPVTATAMYSTRYDAGYGSEVPEAELTGRYFGGLVNYAMGPVAASVSYEQRNSNTVATNTGTERRASVAASYTAGSFKGFAGFRFLRASTNFLPTEPFPLPPGSEAATANMYWLGAQYFVTPAFALTATGYYQDVHATKADPWLAVLLADYFVSKRTDLYALVGYAHNKSNSNVGLIGYGNAAPGYSQTGVTIGIRQKF
jgi:predicted porin